MNEQLKITITASSEGAVQGAKKAKDAMKDMSKEGSSSIDSLKDSLGKIGAAIAAAFTVDAIIGFTQELVNCGAEIAAEEAAFAQIMGDYAGQATEKLGAISDATGIAESRLTAGMTSMTAKWQGLGLGVEEATTKASEGLTVAADAAAFWDMSLEESQSHLNSFINGSYEGGEAIGLFANDTQMALYAVKEGIIEDTKEWANLDEATKQATRLEYAKNMQQMSGVVGQAAKEADSYANVQANLNEKWRQFKGEIGEDLINSIVIPAMQDLSGVVDEAALAYEDIKEKIGAFKDKLGEVKDFCEEHKVAIEILASAFGVLTTAIVAYNIAQAIQAAGGIASVASLAATAIGVGALTVAETVATIATTAFGAALAFLTSPVTLVVAAIAAVIAIIVLMVKHWDTVKEVVGKVVKAIKQFVSDAANAVKEKFNAIKTAISEKIEAAKQAVKEKFEAIKSAIKEKIDGAKQTVSNVFNAIKTTIGNVVKNAFTTVKTTFNNIKTAISTPINAAKTLVSNIFNTIKSKITSGVSGAFNSVKSKFDAIKERVSSVMDSVRDKVQSAIDRIKSIFNITLKFPDIKVPSIRVTGGKMPWGLAGKGVPPNIDIVWHANGGVFDSPALFGYGGGLHGLGEKGAEAIVPLEDHPKWIKALAKELIHQGGNRPIILQLDKKTLAEEVVDGINDLTRQRGSLPLRVM